MEHLSRHSNSSLRCAYCHDDLGEDSLTCPACSVRLHRDCALSIETCPSLGCKEQFVDELSENPEKEVVHETWFERLACWGETCKPRPPKPPACTSYHNKHNGLCATFYYDEFDGAPRGFSYTNCPACKPMHEYLAPTECLRRADELRRGIEFSICLILPSIAAAIWFAWKIYLTIFH